MKENNFNPNDVISRALLLMKYDNKNTLSENVNKIKPVINESDTEDAISGTGAVVGGAAAGVLGTAAATSGAASLATKAGLIAALSNPVGLAVGAGVAATVGTFLYIAYRNADNEGVLRKAMEACSTVEKYGKEDELMKEAVLDKEAHLKIAELFYTGIKHRTWGFMAGTDEEKIEKGAKLMKNANVADICGIIYEYQGEDLADDLAEDLSEGDLAPIVTAFKRAVTKYSGGGIKVIPEGSYNRKYYQEKFPCVYQTKNTVTSTVKIDNEGYTYIIIKGNPRKDANGKTYEKFYRLYADGDGRLMTSSKTNPQPTNARISCVNYKPVAIILGGQGAENDVEMSESVYETYLRNNRLLKEGFDDSKVMIDTGTSVEDNLEGWEDGKKVAPWNVWLQKFGCLRPKFPTGPALTDEQGFTYFINLNPKNNKKYRFYSDGQIWNEEGSKYINLDWSCSKRGGGVLVESYKKRLLEQISFDIPGETDVTTASTTTDTTKVVPGPSPKKEDFKDCTTFPFVQGCYNYKIGEVQSCLKIKPIDAKFGPVTLKALKNNGFGEALTKEVYDKIVDSNGKCKTSTDNSGGPGASTSNLDTPKETNPTDNLSGSETK